MSSNVCDLIASLSVPAASRKPSKQVPTKPVPAKVIAATEGDVPSRGRGPKAKDGRKYRPKAQERQPEIIFDIDDLDDEELETEKNRKDSQARRVRGYCFDFEFGHGVCEDPFCTFIHARDTKYTEKREALFSRNCKNFVNKNGDCPFGDACKFKHNPNDKRIRWCNNYKNYGECTRDKCEFFHNPELARVEGDERPTCPPPFNPKNKSKNVKNKDEKFKAVVSKANVNYGKTRACPDVLRGHECPRIKNGYDCQFLHKWNAEQTCPRIAIGIKCVDGHICPFSHPESA